MSFNDAYDRRYWQGSATTFSIGRSPFYLFQCPGRPCIPWLLSSSQHQSSTYHDLLLPPMIGLSSTSTPFKFIYSLYIPISSLPLLPVPTSHNSSPDLPLPFSSEKGKAPSGSHLSLEHHVTAGLGAFSPTEARQNFQ